MAQKLPPRTNTKKPTSRVGKTNIKKSKGFSIKQMLLVVLPLAAIGVYFVFRSFAATGTIPSTMTLIKTYKAEDLTGGQLKTKSNGLGSYRLINGKTGSYGAGVRTYTTVDLAVSRQVSKACVSYLGGQGTLRITYGANIYQEVIIGSAAGSLCVNTPGGSDATSLEAILNYAKESDAAQIISMNLYKGVEYSFIHHASPEPTDLTGQSLEVFGGDPISVDGRRYRSFKGVAEFESPGASTHITKAELAKTSRICYHYRYLGTEAIGLIGTRTKITVVYSLEDGTTAKSEYAEDIKLDKSGTGCTEWGRGKGGGGGSPIKYADFNISVKNLSGNLFGIDTVYGQTTW